VNFLTEKRPFDVLNNALDENVLIRLKGNKELRGKLASFDIHMNVVIDDCEELGDDGETKRKIGTVLLRGDTIIFISPA